MLLALLVFLLARRAKAQSLPNCKIPLWGRICPCNIKERKWFRRYPDKRGRLNLVRSDKRKMLTEHN